jgi:nucleoside phosphorylase
VATTHTHSDAPARPDSTPILVVAASERELRPAPGADMLCCGIGPVEAAVATARQLGRKRYAAVLQVGIAGARTLTPGSLVIGSESIYADILAPQTTLPRVSRLSAAPLLLEAAAQTLPGASVHPIATTGRVGGGLDYEVEAMEGFGVMRAASLSAVPALELRAISNLVSEPDRSRWQISDALALLHDATARLIAAFLAPSGGEQRERADVGLHDL